MTKTLLTIIATISMSCTASVGTAAEPVRNVFNSQQDVQALTRLEEHVISLTNVDVAMTNVAREAVHADLMLPAWYSGWQEVYDAMKPQYDRVKAVKPSIRELNIATNGNLACVPIFVHADITSKENTREEFSWLEFDVFRKAEDRWLYTQLHATLLVDPKTGNSMPNAPFTERAALQWSHDPLPETAVDVQQAKTELREWLGSRTKATNIDTLMNHFGPGDDVIAYGPYFPGRYQGLKDIRAHFGQTLTNVRAVDATVTDFIVISDGVLGAILARQDLKISKTDGSREDLSIRQSNCLRRVRGKWYSVFEMISFPMDPKNGKPVTRSKQQSAAN
jgi:ketosteroid isomerase-like protein